MNIKEVEKRTGLKAANIRYYEQEGLLRPERNRQNNYREYSQQDVETLERIKMLRALEVPLEKISALQNGKLTLPELMEEREQELLEEIKHMERMKDLCRRVKMSGNTFKDLDAADLNCDFTYYNRKKDRAQHMEKMKRLEEKQDLMKKAVQWTVSAYLILYGIGKIADWQWMLEYTAAFVIVDFCLIAYWVFLKVKLHRQRCEDIL